MTWIIALRIVGAGVLFTVSLFAFYFLGVKHGRELERVALQAEFAKHLEILKEMS